MAHKQAPDPWAEIKKRPRWRLPIDFAEVPPARTPRRVRRLKPLWKVAIEARGTGR